MRGQYFPSSCHRSQLVLVALEGDTNCPVIIISRVAAIRGATQSPYLVIATSVNSDNIQWTHLSAEEQVSAKKSAECVYQEGGIGAVTPTLARTGPWRSWAVWPIMEVTIIPALTSSGCCSTSCPPSHWLRSGTWTASGEPKISLMHGIFLTALSLVHVVHSNTL